MVWKFFNLLFIYLTVPLLLNYLGVEYYGVWATIFTILNAAYFMDLGISLGVKNKLTESLAKNDFLAAKIYVSTAYFSISFVVGIVLLLALFIILYFDMQSVFNTSISERELKLTLILSSILVMFSVVLNIYKSLLNAVQESSKVELAMAIYQGLIVLQIFLLPKIINHSLVVVGLMYGVTNIFIAIIFSIIFFKNNKQLLPSFTYFKKDRIKEILGLGANFFIIQIALIIILTTDNIIITYLIGPSATATYSIVGKVFQPFIIISTFVFTPLWTLYTNAYYNNDYIWIENTFVRLNKLFILLIFVLIALYFNFDWIIKLWIPKPLMYSKVLLICFSLFVLIKIFGDIYMTFLNGIGKIKLQMWLFVFAALINIPLSVFFVKYLNFGVKGVILATCMSLLVLSITMPIQAYKVLKNKSTKTPNRK
jgi:O-antigen/teichoic acid export membrane protein